MIPLLPYALGIATGALAMRWVRRRPFATGVSGATTPAGLRTVVQALPGLTPPVADADTQSTADAPPTTEKELDGSSVARKTTTAAATAKTRTPKRPRTVQKSDATPDKTPEAQ